MTSKIKYNRLKPVLLLLVSFLPLFAIAQGEATTLFRKGNDEFAKWRYKDAITSYQQITGKGYQSAAVYFNLGNAYYKSGDIPSALLYYEKAHKIVPGDEDINSNIRFANAKTVDKIEQPPQFFILNWWDAVILSFPLHTLAIAAILFLLAGFGALIFYLFTQSVVFKKASFYSALALIFSGLLVMFIAGRQDHYFEAHHQAIIFAGTVKVKSEPVDNSKDLFVIHEGTKVELMDNQNGWIKIGLLNGNTGWIRLTDIKEI